MGGNYKKRSLIQSLSELAILLAVVALCTLAVQANGAETYIRRPILTQDLGDPPRLFDCMAGVVKASHQFGGPLLSADRRKASFLLGGTNLKLDFTASPNQRWRYFTYGPETATRIGAAANFMSPVAELVDRQTGTVTGTVNLAPCSMFLGQP